MVQARWHGPAADSARCAGHADPMAAPCYPSHPLARSAHGQRAPRQLPRARARRPTTACLSWRR